MKYIVVYKKKEESNVSQTLSNAEEEIRKEIKDKNRLDENIKAGENGSGFQSIDF